VSPPDQFSLSPDTHHIKANWPGCSWIVEVITTGTRKGKQFTQTHTFLTSLRTAPSALLRLVRQRWSIENEWHWDRDVQLGEDAHRYANRVGAPLFSFFAHGGDEPVAPVWVPLGSCRPAGTRS
jgi:hypothetical protein